MLLSPARPMLHRLVTALPLIDVRRWLRHLLAWLAALVLVSWVSWNYVTDGGDDVTASSDSLAIWYGPVT